MITLEDALLKGHGKWRTFHCPVHGDNSPSARVNSENGWWVCMSCGAKGHASNYVMNVDKALESVIELLDQAEMDPKPESWYDIFDNGGIDGHWLNRFTPHACQVYRLGHDTSTGLPCYPVRNHRGEIVGIVRRDPAGKPKYKYPSHFPASSLLWGKHEIYQNGEFYFWFEGRRVLVVTEGATDVVACYDAQYNAVSTYGAVMHGPQYSQIVAMNPDVVLIAYDMDEAGVKGAKRVMEGLKPLGFFATRVRWEGGKDLNDLDVETRRKVLDEALASSPL